MSLESINLSNIRVDKETGKVSFSGLTSGIDSEAAINDIIAAKRIPIDRIEANITKNSEQIAVLAELENSFMALREAAGRLRGAISVDDADDIFESKVASAAASRADGAAPSSANALLGVNVTNAAETGAHQIEILQRAQAQQVSSTTTFTVGAAVGVAGEFQIGTAGNQPVKTVEILATDTIANIRDKINAANTGADQSDVTASLVYASTTEAILTLTADEENAAVTFDQTTGAPLVDLALTGTSVGAYSEAVGRAISTELATGAATVGSIVAQITGGASREELALRAQAIAAANEGTSAEAAARAARNILFTAAWQTVNQDAQEARLKIDGLIDYSQGAVSAAFSNPPGAATLLGGGRIVITDIDNALSQPVFIPPGSDMAAVAAAVNGVGAIGGGANSAKASIITNDDGAVQLQIQAVDGAGAAVPITVDFSNAVGPGKIGGAVGGSANFTTVERVFERDSNTIDDILEGITLDLLQAEDGAEIELRIEEDLTTIKEAIIAFVDAYNAARSGLNSQRAIDPLTGEPAESAVLHGTAALSQLETQLSLIVSSPADGVDRDGYEVLAQIGVDFVDNASLSDDRLEDTLEIDATLLDDALLNEFDAIRDLFSWRFSSDDARVEILGFNGETSLMNGRQLDVSLAGGALTAATIDGVSATITSGRIMRFESGVAEGLTLYYNGDLTSASFSTNLSNSRGVGANFYFDLDNVLDDDFGYIPTEITALEDSNALHRERVDEQLERLEEQRERLTQQYNAMEAALAQLESLRAQIKSVFDGMNGDR